MNIIQVHRLAGGPTMNIGIATDTSGSRTMIMENKSSIDIVNDMADTFRRQRDRNTLHRLADKLERRGR